MRTVDFIALFPENFKAFTGRHQFNLDKRPGVHFVRGVNDDEPDLGSNGAGKSTLWDALTWCCFGRTLRGLRNPDVKPWQKVKGKTRVALLVQVGKERHTIERCISPNTLKIDGEEAGPEAVVQLLGMTFEIMTNTMLLGQKMDLFFDMQPARKLDVLSDAKRLDRWDERSKRASASVIELEKEHAGYVGEFDGITYAITQAKESLGTFEQSAERWNQELLVKLDEAKTFTAKYGKKIEELQKSVDGYDLRYDSAMTEVKAIQRDLAKHADTLRADSAQMAKLREQRATSQRRGEQLYDEYQKLQGSKQCPLCGSAIKAGSLDDHAAELKREIKALSKDVVAKDNQMIPLEEAILHTEKLQSRLEKQLKEFHAKADEAIHERDKLLPVLEDLKAKQTAVNVLSKKAELQVNPYSKQLQTLKKQIRRMEEDRAAARADRDSCATELLETKPWVKGFKDIKLHVIEELLQELELTTAGMLEEVGLVGWQVQYLIEAETRSGKTVRGITVMIGSPRSKGLVRWEAWSGGESQRLRVVGALALASVLLNHAGVDPSIEVLDEPTQHLSDEGVHDLIAYLADRAKQTQRAIFYCDHQSVESTRFASTILIRKDRAGAVIARQH